MQTGGAEPPLLLGPALGLPAVDRIPSRSVTLNLLQYRTAHPPFSPAHTDKMDTANLCSHIAGKANTVQECLAMQRVASAPPEVPGCYKGNFVPETVWESRGAAALTFGLSTRPLCAR